MNSSCQVGSSVGMGVGMGTHTQAIRLFNHNEKNLTFLGAYSSLNICTCLISTDPQGPESECYGAHRAGEESRLRSAK